jgi:lysophospholipase L1-like esterase
MLYYPLLLLVVVLFGWYKHWEASLYALPKDYPSRSKIVQDKPLLITLGDSITQGNMSASWQKYLSPNLQVLNAGVNADLVQTALQRLEAVSQCAPDFVSILLGTNDVLAAMNKERYNRYVQKGKIYDEVDIEAFERQYRLLVELLLQQTNAQLLIISPPPITEDLSFTTNKTMISYREVLKTIAREYHASYIPFGETLEAALSQNAVQLVDFDKSLSLQKKAIRLYHLFGSTWNKISEERHAQFLTDNVHLNEKAAGILANLLNNKLKELLTEMPGADELIDIEIL